MSLTTKQIDELRAYAAERKGDLAKMINAAADTIETLSAKLSASQLERSSQYYHSGWIPVTERLPEENLETGLGRQYSDEVLMTVVRTADEETIIDYGCTMDGEWFSNFTEAVIPTGWKVTAWMPLPEPYKEDE